MREIKCKFCEELLFEGVSPEELGWVNDGKSWYCTDCYEVDECGEIIFDDGRIKTIDLDEIYSDLEIERSRQGYIKSIKGTLKETGHHISISWVRIYECTVSICHSIDRNVNGYISLVRLVEKYLSESIYTNEISDEVSGCDFVEARNILVESIWQALKCVAGGRFAGDNIFLSSKNRLM